MPRGAGGLPVARAATRRLRRRARAHTALRRGVLDGGESLRPRARGATRAARVVGRAHRAEVTATHFSLLTTPFPTVHVKYMCRHTYAATASHASTNATRIRIPLVSHH